MSELGFAKKARNFAEILEAPLAIVEKRRVGNEDKTELMNIIGEVAGKTAVIIDDEIDTAGSLLEAVAALVAEGATRHLLLRHPRRLLEPVAGAHRGEPADRGDRHRHDPAARQCDRDKVTVLSIAPLFGEAIKRIHRGESVGALFSSEVQLVEEMTFWGSHRDDEEEGPTAVAVEG